MSKQFGSLHDLSTEKSAMTKMKAKQYINLRS